MVLGIKSMTSTTYQTLCPNSVSLDTISQWLSYGVSNIEALWISLRYALELSISNKLETLGHSDIFPSKQYHDFYLFPFTKQKYITKSDMVNPTLQILYLYIGDIFIKHILERNYFKKSKYNKIVLSAYNLQDNSKES